MVHRAPAVNAVNAVNATDFAFVHPPAPASPSARHLQVKGHKYFECGDNHGVLVAPTKVHAVDALDKNGRLPVGQGGRLCT